MDKMKKTDRLLFAILFMLLLTGSVFIISGAHFDITLTLKKYWTLVVGSLLLLVYSIRRLVSSKPETDDHKPLLVSIVLVGILECAFALFQIIKIIPSYNLFYNYTGSFENPAIFAMLLSVCVPVCTWLAFRLQQKWLWITIGLGLFVFTAFSESRTGLLAAIGGIAVVCLMESERLRKLIFNKYVIALIVLLSVALFAYLYFFKEDSANGRLLIWRVALSMLSDRPILGWGPKGFSSMYMVYQADYLSLHPDSPFLLLADNSAIPFNEFVSVLINYGLVGLLAVVSILALIVVRLFKCRYEHKALLLGLTISIIVWSLFSYPFAVPFMWILVAYIVLCAIYGGRTMNVVVGTSVAMVSVIVFIVSLIRFVPEYRWKLISERSMNGESEEMLPSFKDLSAKMSNNENFIYNWAAELHFAHHYEESAMVFNDNLHQLNDYNVQMLLADDYQHMGNPELAIEHYDEAARMVPSKFLPYYYKMNLYLENGDTVNAVQVAEQIVRKDVKVDRFKSVNKIRSEATDLLNLYYY